MAEYTVAAGPEFLELHAAANFPEPDAEERLRQAELFLGLSSLVTYDQPLDSILTTVSRHLVENTRAMAAAVNLVRPSDIATVALGYHNLPAGYLEAMQTARQRSIQGQWMRERAQNDQSWVLHQAPAFMLSQPEYAEMADIVRELEYDTLIGTPFLNRADLMGFVFLYYPADVAVDEAEIAFARELARRARPLMDNAWLFSETQRRANELEALSRADEAMHRSIRLEDVYQAMIELAVNLLHADRALFLTFDEAGTFHAAATRGVPEEHLEGLQAIYRSIERSTFANRGPELGIMEDVATAKFARQGIRQYTDAKSTVDVPVLVRGEFFGMFVLSYWTHHTFSEDEQRLLRSLGTRAGLAIQNAVAFEQAERRANELEALHRGDEAMHQSLNLDAVLQAMVDMGAELLGGNSSLVASWDSRGCLGVRATTGIPEHLHGQIHARFQTITRERLRREPAHSQTLLFVDTTTSTRILPTIEDGGPRSLAEIPVILDGELWGFFNIGWPEPRRFSEDDRRLLDAFAARASLAIQNALVFEASERRRSEIEALYRADEALHQSLNISAVLEVMADLALELLGAESSLVATFGEDDCLQIVASRVPSERILVALRESYRRFNREHFRHRTEAHSALVERASEILNLPAELQELLTGSIAEIPVMVGGEFWAMFTIGWGEPRTFSEDDQRLFDAFASRAGLAIQNALLFEQAQAAASMEERQRIARELHDSVSQALYGIGLGARTARRRLGDQAPADVIEPVDYIVQLAESGLAETRALIFELVPESLAEQGLVLALQRQAAATQSRYRVTVSAYLAEEPDIPVRAKEALYRIAQESLHNMAKHAQATSATVSLSVEGGSVRLVVRDDGRGFDTSEEFPGHLGLRSMAERARRIGGEYTLESAPGAGTTVTVTVPLPG